MTNNEQGSGGWEVESGRNCLETVNPLVITSTSYFYFDIRHSIFPLFLPSIIAASPINDPCVLQSLVSAKQCASETPGWRSEE